MDFSVDRIECSVVLTDKQWKALDELDYLDFVVPMLDKFGAFDIEYNGHFGSRIMFRCENHSQAAQIANEIERMLS